MAGFWQIADSVIRGSDMILFVLDARMPELSRNKRLEEIIEHRGKKMFLVFNKIDMLSPERQKVLGELYPDAFFVSGTKNIGLKAVKTKLLIEGKRGGNPMPKIGVVGYPNVGKSAIINALAHRARAAVSPKAGTTRGVQFVRAGSLKILDTPGVIPLADTETTLALIAAKNPEKLQNPEQVAMQIIQSFLDKDKELLEKHYSIVLESEDSFEILLQIGRKKGFLKKGGVVDETKAAIAVVREWQTGKLRL